jgi:hypothetical protein
MKIQKLESFVTTILANRELIIVVINCMYECLFTHIDGVHVTWSVFVIVLKKYESKAGFPNPVFQWYRRA